MSAKSKKKGEKILLLPGAEGWEAWRGMNGAGLTLALRTEERRALDVDGLPSGDLSMAFPIRDVSSLPFRAATTDEALFGDMAEMHVERLGMRPDVNFGVLNDCFLVGNRGEESLLLPVILAPPPEGALPKRSPQAFDVSARCLPLPSDGVVMWKELGRWVFTLAENGVPMHFQALAATKLNEEAGREIRLTLSQLQMQGLLETPPKHLFIWIGDEEPSIPREELDALGVGFGGSATVVSKPAPVIPSKPSQLLPADVRAERRSKRQKQQRIFAIAAIVLVYVGLIVWGIMALGDANKKADSAEAKLDKIRPDVFVIQDHKVKWEELRPVTELAHWPVELLLQCAKARPDAGLRLERSDVSNQLEISGTGEKSLVRNIRIQGMADKLDQVNSFNLNLKESDELRDYVWNTPPAAETKDGRWGFIYDGVYQPATEN